MGNRKTEPLRKPHSSWAPGATIKPPESENLPVEWSESVRCNIKALQKHCEGESFRGYSLYDSHNSFVPFSKLGKRASFVANQIVKRSPINFRRLLGIRKGINPKGFGLFLYAYALLHKQNAFMDSYTSELMERMFRWLKQNPSKGYSGYCWGYNYDWPRSDGSMFYAYTPNVVVTSFICRGLFEYYRVTGNREVETIIKSATEFVKNDVHCTVTEQGRCYSYTPLQRDLVINANLLAAEILAYDDAICGTAKHLGLVEEVLRFTMKYQNVDGSWYYSIAVDTGEPKKQIDFHQGYILDSIRILTRVYGLHEQRYDDSIRKGLKFYYEKQFDGNGYAYWRVPKIWPVDIHNQSQGILTMCRFADQNEDYLPFAAKIYQWTVNNMLSPTGRFYYQKYRWFTNKTDYLRWNQAWMLVAMAVLYRKLRAGSEDID